MDGKVNFPIPFILVTTTTTTEHEEFEDVEKIYVAPMFHIT